MIALKWIEEKQEYVEIVIPDACSTFEYDLNSYTVCPYCRKMMKFGNMFTSRIIQDKAGFGYSICPECHEQELNESLKNRKE